MATKTQVRKIVSEKEKYFRRFNKSLRQLFKDFGDVVTFSITKDESSVDRELNKIPWDVLETNLAARLSANIKYITENFSDFANSLFEYGLSEETLESVKSTAISRYNLKAGQKISSISDTIRSQIGTIIRNGQRDGLTSEEIADNIAGEFGRISKTRARIIARHETSEATNNVHDDIAIKAEMTKKTWVHTSAAENNRPGHVALNNVTININDSFNVNGFNGDYPHDPSLPFSERISCHCLATYE